jgi:hypothetical protein
LACEDPEPELSLPELEPVPALWEGVVLVVGVAVVGVAVVVAALEALVDDEPALLPALPPLPHAVAPIVSSALANSASSDFTPTASPFSIDNPRTARS